VLSQIEAREAAIRRDGPSEAVDRGEQRLDQEDKDLTEKVEALTREIHASLAR